MTEDFMEKDHAALSEIFRRLDAALGDGDVARAFELLDLAWGRLAVHIRAEHLCLFPSILSALAEVSGAGDPSRPSFAEASETMKHLREDHNFFMRELAVAVKTLRRLSAVAPVKASKGEMKGVRLKIEGVCARLEGHNRLEELKVYRWTETVLDSQAQARLVENLRRELENLPPRFGDTALLTESRRE